MPNIGPLELAIVAVIALLVLGPKRLPDAGRSLGHGLREFKNAITGGGSDDPDEQPPLPAAAEAAPAKAVPPAAVPPAAVPPAAVPPAAVPPAA